MLAVWSRAVVRGASVYDHETNAFLPIPLSGPHHPDPLL